MQELMSTAEAAERLGVSPQRVRALWHAGSLSGRLVANRVLLDRISVLDLNDQHRPSTRPLSSRNAWSLLLMLAGEASSWASASERSRLRRLVMTRDQSDLALLVRSRARTLRFDGVPGARGYVLDDKAVVPAGTTLSHRWTDLMVGQGAEVYTTNSSARDLESRLRLRRDPRGEIVMHVVPHSVGVVLPDRDEMPPAVVAVDLLESTEPRTHRAGQQLWRRSVEDWRASHG